MTSVESQQPAPGGETQAQASASYRLARVAREDWPLWLLFALAFGAAAWVFGSLPERVPVHWNAYGQVDGWGSRMSATFGMLGMLAGTYALVALVPLIDPRRANYAKFLPTHRILRWAIVIVFLGIWAAALAAARGIPVRIDKVVPIVVSLLFIVMGNVMGRVRPNWFVGIRTPWSLSSDEAWRLTHRVSGRAWVIAGLISLAGALVGGLVAVVTMVVAIVAMAAFPVVYSYFAYKRCQRESPQDPGGA
jgi:uncharacterized membrane protein